MNFLFIKDTRKEVKGQATELKIFAIHIILKGLYPECIKSSYKRVINGQRNLRKVGKILELAQKRNLNRH